MTPRVPSPAGASTAEGAAEPSELLRETLSEVAILDQLLDQADANGAEADEAEGLRRLLILRRQRLAAVARCAREELRERCEKSAVGAAEELTAES